MLTPLSSTSDPRLAPYANLTDAQLRALDLHAGRSTFIAEGELVVRKLVASRFPIHSLLLATNAVDRLADLLPTLPPATPVFTADPDLLEELLGFHFHRGVLAAAHRLPPPPLTDLLTSRVLVILENTANTDNLGAVFRNLACLAGKGAAVLLSPGCCDPLYRKALRVSIGHALTIPYASLAPWPDALSLVAAAGFTLTALTPHPSATPLSRTPPTPLPPRYALLLGAEGPGLTQQALSRCTLRLRIPMAEGADSLNVATAAAVALANLINPI